MVVVLFLLPRHEVALRRRRRLRTLLHRVLEQHVHEQVHRLGLDHQGARRLLRAGVEVLVHAIVMHDRDVAGLPVVADAVVDLVAGAVEDVERGLVDVAVLLGGAAGRIFLEMDVQRLGAAVLRLDVVAAEMLRAAVELELLALDDARHRAQPAELVLEAVLAFERADEDAVPCPDRAACHPLAALLRGRASARLIGDDFACRAYPTCRSRRESSPGRRTSASCPPAAA